MNCMYIFILLSSSPIFPDVAEVLKSWICVVVQVHVSFVYVCIFSVCAWVMFCMWCMYVFLVWVHVFVLQVVYMCFGVDIYIHILRMHSYILVAQERGFQFDSW
jgi:hypothetical protein